MRSATSVICWHAGLKLFDSAILPVAGVAFDTMVASYLLNAGERNHSLEELSQRYLDHTCRGLLITGNI